MKMIDQLMSN